MQKLFSHKTTIYYFATKKNKLYIGIYFRGNWEGGWVSCDPEWYVNREWS